MAAEIGRYSFMSCIGEPTMLQVEAAARAWMTWQFPGRDWEDAVPEMKDKFRDGARRALQAAAIVMYLTSD